MNMIAKDIAYVALVSNDVAATSAVFGHQLGLPRNELVSGLTGESVPVFTIGRAALAVVPTGDPMVGGQDKPGVHHIALVSDDIEATRAQLAAQGLERIAGPAQVQLQPEKPHLGLQVGLDPDPEGQFPGIRVEPVQEQVEQVSAHQMRLAKVVDLDTVVPEHLTCSTFREPS